MGRKATSDVLERFVRYCEVPSQSDPRTAQTVPSTPAQFDMARVVAADLRDLGAQDVTLDKHAYVTAHWLASAGAEKRPALAFCCHLDTAWQTYGIPVHPQVKRYEGGRLVLGSGRDGAEVALDPATNPELKDLIGEDLVTSDGTSLLGGDDKAAVAMVVSLLARLSENPSIPHPALALAFVPDEEIGHGAALLDLDALGAAYGYTIDAGPLGEFCYETFNAAEATIRANGRSVHTGTAKDVMVNASEALLRVHQLIPPQDRPEFTQDREGFFYLERIEGNCEDARADYIIRDHDRDRFEARKDLLRSAVAQVNEEYALRPSAAAGQPVLSIEIRDQYRNMAEVITRPENAHLIESARRAYAACGVTMRTVPMRGGTDGAQLSFRGLPCANLSACYHNAHGVTEFVPVRELETMVDVLQELVGIYAEDKLHH